jgi:hypothetical protein
MLCRIFHEILSVPQKTVMALNIVMTCWHLSGFLYRIEEYSIVIESEFPKVLNWTSYSSNSSNSFVNMIFSFIYNLDLHNTIYSVVVAFSPFLV